jgi:hypothetical protein
MSDQAPTPPPAPKPEEPVKIGNVEVKSNVPFVKAK